MADEEVLKLFDSYWFEHEILSSRLCVSSSFTKAIHDHDDHQEQPEPGKVNLPDIAIFRVRSQSEICLRCNTGFSSDAASPKSAISTPRLEKELFGKEASDFPHEVEEQSRIEETVKTKVSHRRRTRRSRRKGRKGLSRSFSDLEYEELKGFMDLGFVFTEEDKASSLVSILPGLQRWGEKESDEPVNDKHIVSRPYLSEAWDVWNQSKVHKPQVNWRIPAMGNENNMKDNLKAWAHTVASSVR